MLRKVQISTSIADIVQFSSLFSLTAKKFTVSITLITTFSHLLFFSVNDKSSSTIYIITQFSRLLSPRRQNPSLVPLSPQTVAWKEDIERVCCFLPVLLLLLPWVMRQLRYGLWVCYLYPRTLSLFYLSLFGILFMSLAFSPSLFHRSAGNVYQSSCSPHGTFLPALHTNSR